MSAHDEPETQRISLAHIRTTSTQSSRCLNESLKYLSLRLSHQILGVYHAAYTVGSVTFVGEWMNNL